MNREVDGTLRTLKTALEARIGGKVSLDHDFISWLVRHSLGSSRERRGTPLSSSSGSSITDVRQFGDIVWARIPTTMKLGKLDQRWVEVVWAGKAEGSDDHTALEHRGAEPSRTQHVEAGSGSRGCWMLLGSSPTTRLICHRFDCST